MGKYDNKAREIHNMIGINFVTACEKGDIDEATAAEHASVFEEWASGVSYAAGAIRRHDECLFVCLQAHTSQQGWEPDPTQTTSLWRKIGDPTQEWPEWTQPVGATDAYDLGAKVSHNGKHWTSGVANNIWEPGVYGWTES